MFYQFLKILVGFTLRIFYRKIYITGTEHVKKGKAQLVASNHPNGFLEPLIMACYFPKDLHFLVRGDVFDNPFLKPILTSTHQIPIFRFRDGFSKLRENSQKMDEGMQVLLENKNLLIFAEGGTQSIKFLRPLQKGIARIAFQTMEKSPQTDLEILPVGINFTYPTRFNKEVMLRVSTPLQVRPYFELYQQDKNKATEALLNDLYARMKENIIHLEDQSRLGTFEDMVVASRIHLKNASVLPVLNNNTQQLDIEKNLASYIDQLKEPEYNSLNDEIKNLKLSLKNQGLKWNDLLKSPLNLYKFLLLIITLIPALIGLIFHGLPIMGGYNFTKSKVRQTEFKASILMVSTLVLTLIMYVILILVIIFTSISWIWLPIIVVSGLSLRLCYTIYTQTIFKGKKGLQDSQKIAQNLVNSLNQKS